MHFATVWESIADVIGDETALVHGENRRTWTEFDQRSARMAAAYVAAGLGHDSKVGLYLYNGNEYVEAHNGAFKMRGVPVNVNYRYLDEELWYLLDNADAEALVFHSSLGDRVARVVDRLPAQHRTMRDALVSLYDRMLRDWCYPCERFMWERRLL